MAAAALPQTWSNWYQTNVGPNFAKFNDVVDVFEYGLQALQGTADIIHYTGALQGKEISSAAKVSSSLGDVRSGVNAARLIFPIEKALSGRLFFEVVDDDNIKDVGMGQIKNTFLKDKNGNKVCRSPLKIALDTSVLAARSMGTTLWLDRHNVVDIGNQARKVMGIVTTALWGLVTVLSGVLSSMAIAKFSKKITEARQKRNDDAVAAAQNNMKKEFAELVHSIIELTSTLFESISSALLKSGSAIPAGLGIAGGALAAATGLSKCISEFCWYYA